MVIQCRSLDHYSLGLTLLVSCVCAEQTDVFRRDPKRFEQLARQHTEQHAVASTSKSGGRGAADCRDAPPVLPPAAPVSSQDQTAAGVDTLISATPLEGADVDGREGWREAGTSRRPAGGFSSDVSDDDESGSDEDEGTGGHRVRKKKKVG
jgi:hypothetical protein